MDAKLTEARNNYAKRALKTLFNGSQKTFQVNIDFKVEKNNDLNDVHKILMVVCLYF